MMKSIGPYYTGHQPSPDPLEQYLRGIDAFEFEGIVQTAIDPNKVSPDDFAKAKLVTGVIIAANLPPRPKCGCPSILKTMPRMMYR